MSTHPSAMQRPAFTLPELLIVVAVIALLLALLFPSIGGVRTSGLMANSMSHLRQIGIAMTSYASDANDKVLPSQFNHADAKFAGHARRGEHFGAEWELRGTWADILWTRQALGVFPEAGVSELGNTYWNDSPDKALYRFLGQVHNPLRSAAANTRDVVRGTQALPYGNGARERGLPGYFAANNFFNDDRLSPTHNWRGPFTTSQIRQPARSMYLIDSYAGEVIEDDPGPFNLCTGDLQQTQVDFRYGGVCLVLFLDDHVRPESPWKTLAELEQDRGVRVQELTRRW